MAEMHTYLSPSQSWKSRKVPQVVWIINEIYNKLWEAVTFNAGRIQKLGDELDKENLLQFNSLTMSSWQTLKGAKHVDKKMLLQLLKDYSEKTFSTRVIFMKWIHSRDKLEYDFFRKKEIDHILETLNKSEKFFDLDKLNWRVVVHGESCTMFETLAIGFEESSDIMVEKILEELKTNRGTMKYKEHDSKKWIQVVLKKKTHAPWDPLVFCVCANIYDCVVSIQANDTDEYRIYPETVSFKSIIKFAHADSSTYLYLNCNKMVFDCKNLSGFYTSDDQRMRETMKRQLAEMTEGQKTKTKQNQDDLVTAHSSSFKTMLHEKKDLQRNVSSLQTSLDEAVERKQESDQSLQKMSKMFDEFLSKKSELDKEIQERQQRDLSAVSRKGNPNHQKDMNQAQYCPTNSIHIKTHGKRQSAKKEETITPVGN